MKDRDAYTVGQFIPLLARLQRQAPREKRYQDRVLTSWLQFIGVPLRTNTDYEQEMEKFRRKLESGELEKIEFFAPTKKK